MFVAGAAVVAAGLYELTPLKRACLRRCRVHVDRRVMNAVVAGWRYGANCVGGGKHDDGAHDRNPRGVASRCSSRRKTPSARDALAAERRRLPTVRIEKDYVFEGPDGKASLRALFDGRRQLIVYHFMFAPGVEGWPEAGCPGCSLFVDQIGHLAHLHARDTSFALVSRAPLANIERYREHMGWAIPWLSSGSPRSR